MVPFVAGLVAAGARLLFPDAIAPLHTGAFVGAAAPRRAGGVHVLVGPGRVMVRPHARRARGLCVAVSGCLESALMSPALCSLTGLTSKLGLSWATCQVGYRHSGLSHRAALFQETARSVACTVPCDCGCHLDVDHGSALPECSMHERASPSGRISRAAGVGTGSREVCGWRAPAPVTLVAWQMC